MFAVIDTASKTGTENDGTGVTYFAVNKHHGIPLTILDWDIVQIEGATLEAWLPSCSAGLKAFAPLSRFGSLGAWIEDKNSGTILLQQARNQYMNAHPIRSKLTSMGKDERAFSASTYVHRVTSNIPSIRSAKLRFTNAGHEIISWNRSRVFVSETKK